MDEQRTCLPPLLSTNSASAGQANSALPASSNGGNHVVTNGIHSHTYESSAHNLPNGSLTINPSSTSSSSRMRHPQSLSTSHRSFAATTAHNSPSTVSPPQMIRSNSTSTAAAMSSGSSSTLNGGGSSAAIQSTTSSSPPGTTTNSLLRRFKRLGSRKKASSVASKPKPK